MYIKKERLKNLLLFVLAITAFIQMQPYFVWTTYKDGIFRLLIPGTLVLCVIMVILFWLVKIIEFEISSISIIIFFVIIWLYRGSIGSENRFLLYAGNWMVLVLIVFFLILKNEDRSKVFHIFSLIFATSLIAGIIIFILISMDIDLQWQTVASEHIGKSAGGSYYKNYFGSVFLYSKWSDITRLSAMYDEPGVVGTMSALFLVADNLQFKGKIKNIIIAVGGILSFSMAFYLIIIIATVIKSFNKNLLRFSATLILILVTFIVIMNIKTDNELIIKTQKRFEIENGKLAGNNREDDLFKYAFNEFLHNDKEKVIWGHGNNAANSNPLMYGSSTYKILIYDFGLIGFLAMVGCIIHSWIKLTKYSGKAIVLLIVFIISMYQRPDVFTIPYMFILLGGYSNLLINKSVN